MTLSQPSYLRRFLDELGIHPNKRLSQHFLIDGNIVRKILTTAEITAGDRVLEIGPGPGVLTEELVAQGAEVYAVEKDQTYATHLQRFPGVQVCCGDICSFDFASLQKEGEGSRRKVVANLPYHLTAPILTALAPRRDLFSTLTLMVQHEVAQRIVARPFTKEYGSLTLFLQFYTRPTYAFFVSRNCFYPRPRVDSAVVYFALQAPPVEVEEEAFFAIVRTAFQHRRKMLTSVFGRAMKPLLEERGKAPTARPEELSLEDFLFLATQRERLL